MPHVKQLNTKTVVLSAILAGLLLIVPASVGVGGNNSALAAGYGQQNNGTNGHGSGNSTNTGAGDDHGNGTNARSSEDHGNTTGSEDRENSTNIHPNNATSDNERGDNNQTGSASEDERHHQNAEDHHDSVEGHGHSAYEREQNYVNETSESRHHEHLSFNETISGPYTANLNYTVTATGNATAISDDSMMKNASLTLHLSIWKSTHSVVSMDIINGTIKIGNNQTQIYSGHAYYLIHHHKLLVYGFIVNNGIGSQGNSSSEHSVRLLKLFMTADGGSLPVSSSDPPLQMTVLDPESKVASEWFLDMNGQVQRS